MFDIWQIFFLLTILLIALSLGLISVQRFEIAVLLVAFSPWISAIFIPNAPLSVNAHEASVGSYLRISALLLMGGVGIVKYFQSWPTHQGKLPLRIALLGLFLIITLISTVYSIDKKFTFVRSASFVAVFGFLLGLDVWLKEKADLDRVLNIIYYLVNFFVVASLIALFVFPEKVWLWNAPNRFQGIWNHPNTMGSFCMISYPIFLWKYARSSVQGKWLISILFIITVGLHILTGSRGSILASLIGISIWFIVRRKNVKLFLYLGISSFVLLLILALNPSRFEREEKPESFTYLTGRTEFWKAALVLIKEKPIFGYGYDVEGKVWQDPRFNNPKLYLWSGSARTSLHNGYISVAIGVGIFGFLIWCILLFFPYWQFAKLKPSDYKGFVLSVFTMIILLNLIETTITGGQSMASMVFWITWIMGGRIPQNSASLT